MGVWMMPTIPPPPLPTTDTLINCDNVDVDQTSEYIPDDWDAWCDGFDDGIAVMVNYTDAELSNLCDGFWELSDAAILDDLMTAMSRDRAIGALDAMWIGCQ